MRATSVLAATLYATGCFAAQTTLDLVALETYASDALGNPIEVGQAENFYCSIRYRVAGTLSKSYTIQFATPYKTLSTPALTFGQGASGDYCVTWGPMLNVVDGPIVLKASLVPAKGVRELSKSNNSTTTTISVRQTQTGLEHFNERQLSATLGLNLQWRSEPGQVVTWFPNAPTDGFQRSSLLQLGGASLSFGSSAFAIHDSSVGGMGITHEIAFASFASNQRTNAAILRTAAFSDYANVPIDARWLIPEVYVESTNPSIRAFAFGARSRAAANTPYDVARSIYQAVLSQVAYSSRPGQAPSASSALRLKRGDCGGMSALFVAACRSVGIPSRTVVGFVEGVDQWHVWAEFLIPGHGWVACDPAYAKGLMPRNTIPTYFGNMPDLNKRFACTFGFDVEIEGRTLPLLQAPTAFWQNANARIARSTAWCRLVSID